MAIQTAERSSHHEVSDNVIFQRHLLTYELASKEVRGKLLEIGCGMGYGIEVLAPCVDSYTGIDKFSTHIPEEVKSKHDITFHQMEVPPFKGIEDNTFDSVVTFQVIEHIKKDVDYLKEIYRVLKPGGVLVMTTPNIKMSLTRNPWHVREYNLQEMKAVIEKGGFKDYEVQGMFGNEKVMAYYENNKKSVQRITRWDIFNLQYNLPAWALRIPYDILNRRNRKKLLTEDQSLVSTVKSTDYYVKEADDQCFDFYCLCRK